MSMMTGFLGGMMSSFIEPIRIGLEESVRRVTVRVTWNETARPEQVIEVIQYLTDPAKLDLALTGGSMAGAAAPTGAAGATGTTNPAANPASRMGFGAFGTGKLPGQP
jgi:hypothetical protein